MGEIIMSDLLKEAIADAKAVRETALQNAKIALEEAFTPQLKSMLSAKLKEDEMEDELPMDDEMGDEEEIPAEEGYMEDEELGDEEEVAVADEVPVEEPALEDEMPVDDEMGDEEEEMGNLDLEAIIRELETELKEEDDAYDENAPADRDGLAEEDDAYDEKAAPEKDGLAEEDDAYDDSPNKEDKNDGIKSSDLAEGEGDDDEEVEVDESIFT